MAFKTIGGKKSAMKTPKIAAGTEIKSIILPNLKSISLALKYAISPEVKPKSSVSRAIPMATDGSSFNHNKNSGEKKTAPPIPVDIATVAMPIEIGNKNQYSNDRAIIIDICNPTRQKSKANNELFFFLDS